MSASVGVFGYVLDSFAPLVDRLEPLRPASPFYLYRGGQPLQGGLHPGHATALLAAALVLVVVALVRFRRRDIGT